MGSFLVWLVLCAAVVAGLTAVVVVLVARRIGPDVGGSGPSMPDFAVVDCGDQIHLVPVGEAGHVIGGGPCPCHPRKTGNRRRSGRPVVYVDHQILAQHSTFGGRAASQPTVCAEVLTTLSELPPEAGSGMVLELVLAATGGDTVIITSGKGLHPSGHVRANVQGGAEIGFAVAAVACVLSAI